jgi:hypothetical protein
MQIVSWGQLIIGLIVVGIIWYGYVLLKYYRHLFRQKSSGNNKPRVKWLREKENSPEQHTEQHNQVHELMQELTLIFAAAVRHELAKDQVKESIAVRLQQFPAFSNAIKFSINQHLINEFSLQLKTNVSSEEINSLWT